MRNRRLSHIEDLAQEMVEGTFGRLFGERLEPLDVANRLTRAIEDNVNGGQMSQNYNVALNPDDYRFLTDNNPGLAESLSSAAQQLGRMAGANTAHRPLVQLGVDKKLKRRQIRITARAGEIDQDPHQRTQPYDAIIHRDDNLRKLMDLDAFLIIQGRRHISLNRPVTTIGRRTENDLVLDLPSVSRQHVIIRWRFGNFILYDISSHGRTLVNGDLAREQILRPGDVITLGDALLVYGEGNPEEIRDRTEGVDEGDTLAHSSRQP